MDGMTSQPCNPLTPIQTRHHLATWLTSEMVSGTCLSARSPKIRTLHHPKSDSVHLNIGKTHGREPRREHIKSTSFRFYDMQRFSQRKSLLYHLLSFIYIHHDWLNMLDMSNHLLMAFNGFSANKLINARLSVSNTQTLRWCFSS